MATQSEIQSLIQNLTGLQSNIQGASQFTANNGNPGTVYNLASPNVRQFNPATGNLPAMGDALGNWAVPAGGTLDPNILAMLQQLFTPRTSVNMTVPPLTLNPLTPPAPVAPTQPPATGPQGGGDVNLNDGPIGTGFGGQAGAAIGSGSVGAGGGSGSLGSGGANASGNGGFYSPATGIWGEAPGLANKLGFNQDGSMNWQQMLDLILPGNLYNSQIGQWNQGNILGSIAQQLLGVTGITGLINKIGERQTTDANPDNDNGWFARQFLQNVTNRSEGLINQTQAQMLNQFANQNNPVMRDYLNSLADKNIEAATQSLTQSADQKAQAAIEAAMSGIGGGGGYEGGGGGLGDFGGGGGGFGGVAGSYGGFGEGALGLGTGLFGGGSGNWGISGGNKSGGTIWDTGAALDLAF